MKSTVNSYEKIKTDVKISAHPSLTDLLVRDLLGYGWDEKFAEKPKRGTLPAAAPDQVPIDSRKNTSPRSKNTERPNEPQHQLEQRKEAENMKRLYSPEDERLATGEPNVLTLDPVKGSSDTLDGIAIKCIAALRNNDMISKTFSELSQDKQDKAQIRYFT